MRKDSNRVVEVFIGWNRFLERFQDGYNVDLRLNQLTVVVVEMITKNDEDEVPTVFAITTETVNFYKIILLWGLYFTTV